ncbi:hypothetical protein CEXT_522551 [Caerostris extrusa]|uniref:Uncharacterized protein n=1 Tax=Caerostris extrusa TaxID=172846 RepID=A0AAV4MNK0_CAEEX|nr:hypothetical protein CEXT_522551 [Caerostris extrusa]
MKTKIFNQGRLIGKKLARKHTKRKKNKKIPTTMHPARCGSSATLLCRRSSLFLFLKRLYNGGHLHAVEEINKRFFTHSAQIIRLHCIRARGFTLSDERIAEEEAR